jgi:hypothetical protein
MQEKERKRRRRKRIVRNMYEPERNVYDKKSWEGIYQWMNIKRTNVKLN